MKTYPKITGSLCANSHPGSYTGQDAFNDMLPVMEREGIDNVLCGEWTAAQRDNAGDIERTGLHAQPTNNYRGGTALEDRSNRKYVLRRLTPTECARLQGFPDWWVDGTEGSDSAIYKMWGNGIALPCAADVLGRIAHAIKNEANIKRD